MGYVFTLLVVLLPFLGQIGLPIDLPFVSENLSVGVLLLIPFIVVYLCDKWPVKGLFAIRPVRLGGTVLFAIVLLVVSVLGARASGGTLGGVFPSLLWVIFLPLLILAARGNFRVSYGMTSYVFLSLAFSYYLILQLILLRRGYGALTDGFFSESYIFAGAELGRFVDTGIPASLFLSADGFSLYVLPALAYLLLWNRSGYRFFPFVGGLVISVALYFSESSIGIVFALLIWAIYLLLPLLYFLLHPADAVYRFLHGGAPRITLLVITFVICTSLVSLYLLDGTAKALILPNLKAVFGSESLTAGFSAISEILKTKEQLLFGVGLGNLDAAFSAIGKSVPPLSTLSELLLSVGVVGLGAFALLLLMLLVRSRGKYGYVLSLLLILLCAVTRIPMLPTFLFWFFLSHSVGKTEMPFRRYMRVEY